MAVAPAFVSSTPTAGMLVGGLGGGYFVTGIFSGTAGFHLRSVADPATVVDAVSVHYGYYDGADSANGTAVAITRPAFTSTTRYVNVITQSSGSLSVTQVGSFTIPSGSYRVGGVRLSYDASKAVIRYWATSHVSQVDLATGSLDWTVDPSTLGHSIANLLGTPGAGYFVQLCNTHGRVELWDSTSELSSVAEPTSGFYTFPKVRPLTSSRLFYVDQVWATDPNDVVAGVLDASSSLAWSLTPVTISTNWTGTDHYVQAGSFGDAVWFGPELPDAESPPPPPT